MYVSDNTTSDTAALTLVLDSSAVGFDVRGTYRTTEALAQADLALFPKSDGLRVTRIGGLGGDYSAHHYYISGRGVLRANGVNGGKNETGIRRYRTVVKAAAKVGVEVTWAAHSQTTREAFEAGL